MSLVQQARQALESSGAFSTGSQTLTAAASGLRLVCDLAALDHLACTFTRFEVTSDSLAGASIDELKRVSQTLAARLTYLLEPIAPIEIDAGQCVIQMRSNPPQRDEQGTSYYELLVRRGGELSLCRWSKQAHQARERLPAHVTRQVFLRLVGDFAAVVAG